MIFRAVKTINRAWLSSPESIRGMPAILLILVLPILISGCNLFGSESPTTTYDFDFTASDHGWEAFFTGYPVGWDEKMELTADHRSLPDSSAPSGKGLYISAVNNSDNVKMLFRRQVEGLTPGQTYDARFTVRFATRAPSGCVGIGGPPGEGVRVLADVSVHRPEAFVNDQDRYRLNLQYRHNDSRDWYERVQMGNIANSRDCEEERRYEIKELTSDAGHATVTADEAGQAWLLFGTRSGFEGKTSLYYTHIRVELY